MTAPTARLVTIPDTGQQLGGVSRTTIYDLVEKGELTKVNIGRRSFVTQASLDAYVDKITQAATSITDGTTESDIIGTPESPLPAINISPPAPPAPSSEEPR